VVGPPVNHAARLESLTIGSQIHVSAMALDAATVEVSSRGPLEVQVKGSTDALVYFELLGVNGRPDLDVEQVTGHMAPMSLPARFARLEGKRVPKARTECRTEAVGTERVHLAVAAGLDLRDSVVVELELPDHGWTGPLWAKVLAQEDGITELALTSGDPPDLEALGALAGSD